MFDAACGLGPGLTPNAGDSARRSLLSEDGPDRAAEVRNANRKDWTDELMDKAAIAGDCLGTAAMDHYGISAAAAITGALGAPIPKTWVPPFRSIGSDSTTILSALGHFLDIEVPRVVVAGLGSTNLLRIAGRLAPAASALLFAYDVAAITIDTWKCYNAKTNDSTAP